MTGRDECISGIPMGPVGSMGIPREWEIVCVWMGKSMGMAWLEWEGMTTLYFLISHPEQASKPTRSLCSILLERKTGIGEKWPNLDIIMYL